MGMPELDFSSSQTLEAALNVEISNIFQTPTNIDLREQSVIMFEEISERVAENYATDVFSLQEIR